jgi:hypothetical protein
MTIHIVDGKSKADSDKSHSCPERFESKETIRRALDRRDL